MSSPSSLPSLPSFPCTAATTVPCPVQSSPFLTLTIQYHTYPQHPPFQSTLSPPPPHSETSLVTLGSSVTIYAAPSQSQAETHANPRMRDIPPLRALLTNQQPSLSAPQRALRLACEAPSSRHSDLE
ncbi:hypothetical protein DL98DRAFT_515770 [Cadophora sp. DSE1049]|nr:hypothetical protein DL98DRAFT_515770 [Cadophora sp. DSE1049]